MSKETLSTSQEENPEHRNALEEKYKEGGKVKLNEGGYIGPAIKAEYGGVKLSNPYNKKYYKGLV